MKKFALRLVGGLVLFGLTIAVLAACSNIFGDVDKLRPKAKTNSYTVEFDANGGGGTMKGQDIAPGVSQALNANAFTAPSGMSFAGWSDSANGAVLYIDKAAVQDLAKTGETFKLYARWGYKVSFNSDGGTAVPDQVVLPGGTVTKPTLSMTKTGYTFIFWYLDDPATQWNFTSDTVSGEMTLNARWNPVSGTTSYYTVEFELNGAHDITGQYGDLQWPAGTPIDRPDNPVKDNFTFGGWYTTQDFSGSLYNFNNPVTGPLTLYAKWQCTVSFNTNDGSPVPGVQTVDIGATLATVTDPVKDNYNFVAWYSDSGFVAGSLWVIGTSTVATNMTLHAQWACTITFDKNNTDIGSADANPQAKTVITPASTVVTLPAPPTRPNWTFNGWNTKADGTGAAFTEATTVTGTVTVYARWLLDLEMIQISAGNFQMGSPASELGRSENEIQHAVTLTSDFYMGKYEVTQAQYQAVMGTTITAQQTLAGYDSTNYGQGDNYPMYCVSWYDAVEFCNALSGIEGLMPYYTIDKNQKDPNNTNADAVDPYKWLVTPNPGANGYRLPTEAQWEYACRAGTTTAFNWGTDTIDSTQANYDATNTSDAYYQAEGTYLGKTTIVGSYAPNAWGLYDMHGNVLEWCWDWYGIDWSESQQGDPTGAVSGDYRVRRGGAWGSYGLILRSACRVVSSPSIGYRSDGFRLVRP